VTSLSATFYRASSFNQPLADWDTSSVTSLYDTFRDASSFNQPLADWDTSSVTSLQGTFIGATALSDCNKAQIHTVFSTNSNYGTITTNNQDWSTLARCPPSPFPPFPPPSSPALPPPWSPSPATADGAVMELTGAAPAILFGEADAPVCELRLERDTARLVSSCPIFVAAEGEGGRRLRDEAAVAPSHAEVGALRAEVEALRRTVTELITAHAPK